MLGASIRRSTAALCSMCLETRLSPASTTKAMGSIRPRTLLPTLRSLHTTSFSPKTFEPSYLEITRELPPTYPLINVQIKGFDFHILEKYQKFVHHVCDNIGIEVVDGWATPCKTQVIRTFHVGGNAVRDEYELNIYERNVQISKLSTTDAPILIAILRRSLPEGVSISIHEHTQEHYEARVIPDPFVESMKQELIGMEIEQEEAREQATQKKLAREARKKESLLAAFRDDDEEF